MKKLVLLMTLLAAPVATTAAVAQTEPGSTTDDSAVGDTIVGSITSVSGSEVLVEEDPQDPIEGGTGSDKGSFSVTGETQILRLQGGVLVPATFEELAVGQLVAATYSGPVLLSYPSRGGAGSIVIVEDIPEEAPVDGTLPDEGAADMQYESAA